MSDWVRVSKRCPCPVCQRTDWCLVAEDGSAAICPRTESPKRCGEAGWLHDLTRDGRPAPMPKPMSISLADKPKIRSEEIGALSRRLQTAADRSGVIDKIAAELGLDPKLLFRFGVGSSILEEFSSWPMFDDRGGIVGITRRFADGSKKIMAGHRAGLYMPTDLPESLFRIEGILVVTEGASDAVAGLGMGMWTVGRFSCTHGATLLAKLMGRLRPACVVLVGDTDGPGQRGVESLASALLPYARALKVIAPPAPHKDLRDWYLVGATLIDFMRLVDAARPRRLGVKVGPE